jgi:hypothetical protein
MFFIIQAVMVCYALASAWQEKSVVRAFIDYVPIGNKYQKGFHSAGAFMTVIVAVALSYINQTLPAQIVSLFTLLAIYWLVFDTALNVFLKGWSKWDYIGGTSILDKFLNKIFNRNAGKLKAVGCVAIIVVLNILI